VVLLSGKGDVIQIRGIEEGSRRRKRRRRRRRRRRRNLRFSRTRNRRS
jgi:hypothetical protein